MRCEAHPDVETNLRCGKCDKPICPRCMVETPVGMKCRECARLQRPPMFRVSGALYLRAVGTGIVLSAGFGFLWALLRVGVRFSDFLSFFISLGVGYLTGEAIYLTAGHKRGPGLATIAGASVVVTYFLALLVFPEILSSIRYGIGIFDILFAGAGVLMAVNALR
jgi:hypothetical protein